MQNFVRTRVAIDSLIDGTKLSIQNKSISESMEQIEQARELIQKLKQMSTSDQDCYRCQTRIDYRSFSDERR